MYKKIDKYFASHPTFNSLTHLALGIGFGVIISRPYAGTHPVRFGLVFLTIGLFGHLYPLLTNKLK